MPARPKREYHVDREPYAQLIQEFLTVALLDPSYASRVARTATTILAKRKSFEDRKA